MFNRYLIKNFLKVFALMLFSVVFVFIVIDFVGNIKTWLIRPTEDAVQYYLNYLPHIVYLILPIAVMLSVIASIGNMAKHLEITAMVGSGRSVARIMTPLIITGFLISSASYVLGETILPDANHKRLELMQPRKMQKKKLRKNDRSRYVFIGEKKETLYFKHYSGKGKIGREVIILLFEDGNLAQRYDAQKMKWVDESKRKKSSYWKLYSGTHRKFGKDGSVTLRKFRRHNLKGQLNVHPEELLNTRHTADEMNAEQIRERIAVLKRTGEATEPMETQLHFKYSGHLVSFVLLIIGAAVSHRFSRRAGLSRQFVIGLLAIFSYYVIIKVGVKMGESGALDPWLGAWIGNIIFGFIAVVVFIRSLRL